MRSSFFLSLARGLLIGLFGLLPVFFFPWSQDMLETGKQALLVVISVFVLLVSIWTMVMRKRAEVRSAFGVYVAPGFALATCLSACASFAWARAWFGIGGQEYVSAITTIAMVGGFLSLAHLFEAPHRRQALNAWMGGVALASVMGVVSLFGASLLPFVQTPLFNPVGSVHALALVALVTMFIGSEKWKTDGLWMRLLTLVQGGLAAVLLVAVNFWVLWMLLVVGVCLHVVFSAGRAKELPSVKSLIPSFLCLFVAIFFLILPSPFPLKSPVLISPSAQASWQIARSTLDTRATTWFLGSGPGTFGLQYQQFRQVGLNNTVLWSTVFDRAQSAFLTRLSDVGVLGTSVWLVWVLMVVVAMVKRARSPMDSTEAAMLFAIGLPWILCVVAQFFVASNLTIEWMVWGFGGLLVGESVSATRTFVARSRSMVFGGGLLVAIAGSASLLIVSVLIAGRLVGDVLFARAAALSRANGSVEEIVHTLERARLMNRFDDRYAFTLSSAEFVWAKQLLSQSASPVTEAQANLVSQHVTKAIEAGEKAIALNPISARYWQARGGMYRDLMSSVSVAATRSAEAFMRAIALDPYNPVYRVDLARVYLFAADYAKTAGQDKTGEEAKAFVSEQTKWAAAAEDVLNKAIALKGDYLPAHYYLAAAYDREGKNAQATERLQALTKANPNDVGVGFELAQLYLRANKSDLAQAELERILVVNPQYANALWYLAGIFESKGDKARAIELIKQVIVLNPQSTQAQDRLHDLESGIASTVLAEPLHAAESETNP